MNLICDWNGTLFEYAGDEVQNKAIAYAAAAEARRAILRGRVWRLMDLVELLRTKRLLEQRVEEFFNGQRHLWEVYEPFNECVIRGLPVACITRAIDRYARASAALVDARMLEPIAEAKRAGARTGILSVSYDYSILKVLEAGGFPHVFDPTDVVSNRLLQDGDTAVGLTLEIYEKKRQIFEDAFFGERGLDPAETFYTGDRLDDDGPVASLLPPGHFIVPLLASDDTKQAFATEHAAFVPESKADLSRYLAKH